MDLGAHATIGGCGDTNENGAYRPTVLTDVRPHMRAYHEELFGPVAVVYCASSTTEAIDIANATKFGLGASVWSSNSEIARDVADRLECGMVWINAVPLTAPHLPFGGVKASGHGRDLGPQGFEAFVNFKLTVQGI